MPPSQSSLAKKKYGEEEVAERAFLYAEYVLEIDPSNKRYFPKLNLSERDSRLAESSLTIDINKSIDHPITAKT